MLNPYLSLAEVRRPSGEPLAFHRGLAEYRPTPVRSLPGVAASLGLGEVLVKDESERLGLTSFKALGGSWAVEMARRTVPGLATVVAASAGNHGLAVAHAAAALGLGCRIYLPAAAAPAQAERIAAAGARLVRVNGDYEAAVAAAVAATAGTAAAQTAGATAAQTTGATAAQTTGAAGAATAQTAGAAATQTNGADRTVLIADVSDDPGAPSPHWVVDGYGTLFAELDGPPADVVLVPAGVGSLAAAAVRWAGQHHASVIAVEPDTAACVAAALAAGKPVRIPTPGTSMAGLNCGIASAAAWPALRAGLAGAVQVADAAVHQAMRDLAGWGLAIGDCGAAPLAGLRDLMTHNRYRPLRERAGLGPGSRVLLLATEGITDPDSYRAIMR